MATATKKKAGGKKPQASNPLNFKQLLGRVQKHEAAASLIKTAATTGWLTDETFLTRLSEKEAAELKEVYTASAEAKRAKPADLANALPPTVGPMADVPNKITGERVKLTAGTRTVEVDARLFKTMQKRHPKALVYLSPEGGDDQPVVFSEKTTVAVLPTLKD